MDILLDTGSWQSLLVQALILTYTMVAGGWVLAKAGRSPLWVLFLLVPHVAVIAIWVFAYVEWPFLKRMAGGGAGGGVTDGAADGAGKAPPVP